MRGWHVIWGSCGQAHFRKYQRSSSPGSRRQDSFRTYGPVLRAGICRLRCAALGFYQNIQPRSQGRYLSAEVRAPQTAPLIPNPLRDPGPCRRQGPPFRNSFRGDAVVFFLHTGVMLFGHSQDAPSRSASEMLSCNKKKTLCRDGFLRQAPLRCHTARLRPNGLRTAEALRPGLVRNTWPARHPG